MGISETLMSLLLAGLLGMVGQGARAVVGLKKLTDENAAKAPNQTDSFVASRLLVSLFIGFIAGVVTGISLGLKKLASFDPDNIDLLIGLAAAGYAGADVVEAFIRRTPGVTTPAGKSGETQAGTSSEVGGPAGGTAQGAGGPKGEGPSGEGQQAVTDLLKAQALNLQAHTQSLASLSAITSKLADIVQVPAAGPATQHGDGFDQVTPELVRQMFPAATSAGNIAKHLPDVLSGLRAKKLVDRPMLLMALATIRAETEDFAPISEFVGKYNTDKVPFDKYEHGTAIGAKLGNTHAGDGARFKGRGFVQLTGRDNYQRIGNQIGVDLVGSPELANDSALAGLILAQFLANKQADIRAALAAGDLAKARKLVNGGSHSLNRFKETFAKGEECIPDF